MDFDEALAKTGNNPDLAIRLLEADAKQKQADALLRAAKAFERISVLGYLKIDIM